MVLDYQLFAKLSVWVAHSFFCAALIPQIRLNYRLKTTKGLSDLLIIGYLNGYISYTYYAFLLHLPLAYRVMVPLATCLMLCIVFQRFYYAQYNKKDWFLLFIFLLNMGIAVGILPTAIKYSYGFGYFFGWSMMLIWATYQLPQVIKVFFEKTVRGFSFSLVSFVAFGDLIELIVAMGLGLPWPTIANDFRGVLIYLVFCFQFWFYTEPELRRIKWFNPY